MVVAERVKQMEGGRGGRGRKGEKDCCIQPGFYIVNWLFLPLYHLSMESGMLQTWWNLLELLKWTT